MKKGKKTLKSNELDFEIEKIEKNHKKLIDENEAYNLKVDEFNNSQDESINFDEIVRCSTDVYNTLDAIDFAIMERSMGERATALKMKCFELMEFSINELYKAAIEDADKPNEVDKTV